MTTTATLTVHQVCVLYAMHELRDAGRSPVTKRDIIAATRASKPTLIGILGQFEDFGWVMATRSLNEHRAPNATLYALTCEVPTREDLLAAEPPL